MVKSGTNEYSVSNKIKNGGEIMELRLKFGVGALWIQGSVCIILGRFTDELFPMLGWAHNPGFSWLGQGLLIIWGIGNILLGTMILMDWKSAWE